MYLGALRLRLGVEELWLLMEEDEARWMVLKLEKFGCSRASAFCGRLPTRTLSHSTPHNNETM